ncbi:MAG: hypothetical protein ABR507_00435 [Actinomycetota bacterium]|nr:hypothetical protein [Actinomycetota bacterium]
MKRILVLLTTSLFVLAGSPAFADLSLKVQPLRAPLGSAVEVRGGSCAPGAVIAIDLKTTTGDLKDSLTADDLGVFTATLTVPPASGTGRAVLSASCDDETGQRLKAAAYLLIVRPPLVVNLVNILFGVGSAMFVGGFLMTIRRRAHSRRRKVRRTGAVGA